MYFRNDIEVSASDIEILNSNCIHFKFNFNNTIIELTAIYRSPNLNKAEFINDVESFLINKKNVNNHIIVGDINIQILDDSMDDLGHRYMNIMYEFGFYQLLKSVTRPQSKNCLDHIFFKTNNKLLEFIPSVYHSNITDHYTTTALITFINKVDFEDSETYKYNSNINYDDLLLDISNETWDTVMSCNDPDNGIEIFYQILNTNIIKHTNKTTQKVSSKFKKIKPWITNGIVKSIRTRDKLASKLRKEPFNIILKNKFKKFRNILSNVIKRAKANYFSIKLEKYSNNSKMFWQTVREAANIEVNKKEQFNEIVSRNGLILSDKNILQQNLTRILQTLAWILYRL